MARPEILNIADRFEPRLARALARSFEDLRSSVSMAQIQRALETQGAAGVLALYNQAEGVIQTAASEELRGAIRESGRMTLGLMPGEAVLDPNFVFNTLNPATVDFIRQYEFNLVRQISDETRNAIQQAIMRDTISGANPRSTARTVRDTVGLTARQEQAVTNYRRSLENLDRDAIRRALRDKRFDPSVLAAIRAGNPIPQEKIDRMVGRYRERFIKYRTEVIARTEALRAATVGQQAAMRQMVAGAAVDASRVKRFWVYTHDKRTRMSHREIPGMNPEGVDMDGGMYQTPLGPLQYPRDPNGIGSNTIQCRCAERFGLAEKKKPPLRMLPKPKPKPKPKVTPELKELRQQKVRAMRSMLRAPDSLNVNTKGWDNKLQQASEWISLDELRELRSKGLKIQVFNKNKSQFRAGYVSAVQPRRRVPTRGRNRGQQVPDEIKVGKIELAKNDSFDVIAHELSHAVDDLRNKGKGTGLMWNAEIRQEFKDLVKTSGNKRGIYRNGDGEYWKDNWISNYEGRIYAGFGDGDEWWAMNIQRYATMRAKPGNRTAELIWEKAKKRYPVLTSYIEKNFGDDLLAPVKSKKELLRETYEQFNRELGPGNIKTTEARIAWARELSPSELRAEKAKVFTEMVRLPKALKIEDFAERIEDASRWVPYDVLVAMRQRNYTVNIKNRWARGGTKAPKGKGFRAHANNKHSYLAKDDTGDVFAHEFAHQIDAFFSGNNIDRGAWTNKAFIGKMREGYKKFFHKYRTNQKGIYSNGDGEFWKDNWLNNYEGRIYKWAGKESDGLEFWAMNCQRYAMHKAGKNIPGLAPWGMTKRRYPELAKFIENLFEGDFMT
jgi:hypothetical protein